MAKNNGNGYPPKVELQLNQETRLKILRPVKVGKNGSDPYYLYRVVELDTGEERSLFAPAEIHSVIQENKLGVGSEFLLKRVANGTKNGSKLELSLVSAAPPPPTSASTEPQSDNLKEIMLQCLSEAVEITRGFKDVPFQNDDVRTICASLFIARTRLS